MKILIFLFFLKYGIASAAPVAVTFGTHFGGSKSSTDPSGSVMGAEAQIAWLGWYEDGLLLAPLAGLRQSYLRNNDEFFEEGASPRHSYIGRYYELQTLYAGVNLRKQMSSLGGLRASLTPQLGWTAARLKVDESIAQQMYTRYRFSRFGGTFYGLSLGIEKKLTPSLALRLQGQANWTNLDQGDLQGEYVRQSKKDLRSPRLSLTGLTNQDMFEIPSKQLLRSIEAGVSIIYTIR